MDQSKHKHESSYLASRPSEDNQTIRLKYKYDSSYLAPRPYEDNPSLVWWNSYDREWTLVHDLKFTNENLNSDEIEFDIPIKTKLLEPDDSIWVECLVEVNLDDGTKAISKTGAGQILLSELFASKSHRVTLDLTTNCYFEDKTPFCKGVIQLQIDKDQIKNVANKIKFKKPKEYHLLEQNKNSIWDIISLNVERETCIFQRAITTKLLDETKGLSSNFFLSEVGPVSSNAFWLQWHETKQQEPYFENIFKTALSRVRMDSSQFIQSVNDQFNSKSENISLDFLKAVRVTIEALCAPSVCVPYYGDYIYKTRRESSKLEKYDPKTDESMRETIERFSYPMHPKGRGGGDCEDKAMCIIQHVARFAMGDPALKDQSKEHKKNGGWNSPLLEAAQKVIGLYVPCGMLGTVTSSFLGNSDEGRKGPPDINSNEFLNANIGGHMWTQFFPKCRILKALQIGGSTDFSKNLDLLKSSHKWEKNMPVLLGEGTGDICPYFLPWSMVSNDPEVKKTLRNDQITAMQAKRNVIMNKKSAMAATFQIHQSVLDDSDTSDNSFSTFYRAIVQVFTPHFVQNKLDVTQFYPVTKGSRSKDSQNNQTLKHGCHIKDTFKGEDWFGLIPVPGLTEQEALIHNSLYRHMPPVKPSTFTDFPKIKQRFDIVHRKLIANIQRYGHFEIVPPGYELVNLYYPLEKIELYKSEDFDNFKQDINTNPNVSKIFVDLEIFDVNTYQIRVDLLVKIENTDKEKHIGAELINPFIKPKGYLHNSKFRV